MKVKRARIEIAPLIDVLFLLLFFFMTSAYSSLQTDVSVVSKSGSGEDKVMRVHLTDKGRILWNSDPVGKALLKNKISEAVRHGSQFAFSADGSVPHQRFSALVALAVEAGADKIRLALD